MANVKKWYPSTADFPDPKQHEAIRQILDLVYSQQGQIDASQEEHGKTAAALKSHDSRIKKTEEAGGPTTTKITGLRVKGVPPKDGQSLKYSAASGDIEWTT